jgi:hypothetical protein
MHGSIIGLLLTVGVFETVRIDREGTDITRNNNKQTNKQTSRGPFLLGEASRFFQLVSATRSTIPRSLVAVLGQIIAV